MAHGEVEAQVGTRGGSKGDGQEGSREEEEEELLGGRVRVDVAAPILGDYPNAHGPREVSAAADPCDCLIDSRAAQDISKHSRAARRAEEPVDKSLVSDASTIKPTRPKVTASVLASQNAGISKKQKQKHMTHQQRVRQERALEKADANMDKHERKVEKSKKRGRTVEERRKDWETLNGDKKQPNPFAALGNINTDDVDMEASSGPRESLAAINAATIAAVAQRPQAQKNAPAQDESDLEVE